jgi:putrescine transport system permease protein
VDILASPQRRGSYRLNVLTGSEKFRDTLWQRVAIAAPYIWLFVFFLLPFAIILKISLADPVVAQPPYTPAFDESGSLAISADNFAFLLKDSLYALTYMKSLLMAGAATLCCLVLGYPMAYGIARSNPQTRNLLLLLVILPFWISFLLRVYAWMGLLNNYGVINNLLISIGIIDSPIRLIYTDLAVFIGLTYSYLPFMILPLYATLERLDFDLIEAAQDLGASATGAFWDITWPLSRAGVIAGCLLVFIPATGEYVIPYLLGGPNSLLIGRVLFDEFFVNRDWPLASAVAVVMLILLVAPIMLWKHYEAKAVEDAT